MKSACTLAMMVVLLLSGLATSMELRQSVFERELHRIRYETTLGSPERDKWYTEDDPSTHASDWSGPRTQLKSPAKAFFLSLAVPGLGQWYYGSKLKPWLFFSAEVTAWVFYDKWHGEGNDLTAEYEAFNQTHWSRERYEQKYLLWTYEVTDDDLIEGISHHLPDTSTQQYYEMTGKYDQFAWGWDDAVLNDSTLDDFDSNNPPPPILNDATTPYSARRFVYEDMRDNANNKYDRATRMIFVSLANRLISAFEAYFVTKSRNNRVNGTGGDFARFRMKADLKSYYTKSDTPFFTFTYKF